MERLKYISLLFIGMWFDKILLKSLKDDGKNVCIFSDELSEILNDYHHNSFNFSNTLFYKWKSRKKAIPLKVVLKIMDDKGLKKLFVNYFSVGGGNKIKFPRDKDIRFSYFLGLILGDGCLVHRKRGNNKNTYSLRLYINNTKSLNYIKNLITELFNLSPSIYPAKGCFQVSVFSKPLVMILNKKYQIPIGVKYNLIKIPNLINKGTKIFKIAFLKGIFESDGNLYTYRKAKAVQLRQKSESFIKELSKMFNEVGIEFREPYYDKANNSWILWSSKKQLVDNFIKNIINFKI
jgi:intein/homing endonuclease